MTTPLFISQNTWGSDSAHSHLADIILWKHIAHRQGTLSTLLMKGHEHKGTELSDLILYRLMFYLGQNRSSLPVCLYYIFNLSCFLLIVPGENTVCRQTESKSNIFPLSHQRKTCLCVLSTAQEMWKNFHTNNQLLKSPGSNWYLKTNFH